MTTLSEYISESILSSTRTGKAGIDEVLRQYGLDPAKATLNADGTIDYDGYVLLNNKNLTNLSKLPFKFRNVNGDFSCCNNQLTTLDGCPRIVKGDFDCSYNKLVNLKGGPKQVGGHYLCYDNELTSLEGLPKKLSLKLYCYGNPGQFTKEDVLAVCKIQKTNIHL